MNKRFSGCHPLGTLHIMYFTSMPVVFSLSCTALHSHTPMDGLTTEVDIKYRSVIALKNKQDAIISSILFTIFIKTSINEAVSI